jgi:glutamate:GABA antiporter
VNAAQASETGDGSASQIVLPRELRLADLVLFNVVAALGPQLIPAFAHVGPVAIPLHLAAAALFFVPCALVVANLSRRFPGEGGFYLWTRHAFGDWHAFLCGWCWWISVLLYLPGLVLMGVGMATLAVGTAGTALAEDTHWQVSFAIAVLWLTVGVNILGLRVSKWLSNVAGALIYTGGALVLAASIAVWVRHGSATQFKFSSVLHSALNLEGLSLWAQIAFAYTGLELGSLMGGEVCNPRQTIPRAALLSAGGVTAGYVIGTISLMVLVVPHDLNPINGWVQAASAAGSRLGFSSLGFATAALLFAGILGKLTTWGGGAARLPMSFGIAGAFPKIFTRLHPRWRTPWVALVIQGVACSSFLLLTQAGETVRSGWQLLMDMEILIAFVPFIYIFLCALKFGQPWSGAAGLSVTVAAMIFALVPPENASSVILFEVKAIGGCGLLVLFGWLAFRPPANCRS